MGIEGVLLFIIGLSVGSFLLVAVERFDTAESLWISRSHCNHCQNRLKWYQLLPVVSYLTLYGKCADCKKPIPKLYPIFELVTGVLFAMLYLTAPQPMHYGVLFLDLLVVSVLLFLFWYDWLNQSFPVSALGVALGVVVLAGLARVGGYGAMPLDSVVNDPVFGWLSSPHNRAASLFMGGLVGSGVLALISLPSKGQWMGYGDVLLSGILGLWLGYPLILIALPLAFYTGAAVGIWYLATGKVKQDHRIAFGPFLIIGAWLAFLCGEQIFAWVLRLWGAA